MDSLEMSHDEWFEKELKDEDKETFDILLKEGYHFCAMRGCIELSVADIKDFKIAYIGWFFNEDDIYLHLLKEEFGVNRNLVKLLKWFSFESYREEKEEGILSYEDAGIIYAFKTVEEVKNDEF